MRLRLGQLMLALGIQQTGKVRVQPLITGDELIGCGQTRQDAALFDPEDGAEGSTEEDSLYRGKGHETRGPVGLLGIHPLKSPLGLLLDTGNGLNGPQNIGLLGPLLDVRVDQQRIGLGMDGLHHQLNAVEELGLRHLDL